MEQLDPIVDSHLLPTGFDRPLKYHGVDFGRIQMTTAPKPVRSISTPRSSSAAAVDSLSQARPRAGMAKQSGDVRRGGRQRLHDTGLGFHALVTGARRRGAGIHPGRLGLALVHRAVSLTSPRRWPRDAARRRPTRCGRARRDVQAKRLRRTSYAPRTVHRGGLAPELAARTTSYFGRSRRHDPQPTAK